MMLSSALVVLFSMCFCGSHLCCCRRCGCFQRCGSTCSFLLCCSSVVRSVLCKRFHFLGCVQAPQLRLPPGKFLTGAPKSSSSTVLNMSLAHHIYVRWLWRRRINRRGLHTTATTSTTSFIITITNSYTTTTTPVIPL